MLTIVESSIKWECVLLARILYLVISEKVPQVVFPCFFVGGFCEKGWKHVVRERWCLDLDLSLLSFPNGLGEGSYNTKKQRPLHATLSIRLPHIVRI